MKTLACVAVFVCICAGLTFAQADGNQPVCFSVDGGAFWVHRPSPNPAEGLHPKQSSPNDVFSLGTAGGHGLPTQADIFMSPANITNITNKLAMSGHGLSPGPIAPPPAFPPPIQPPGALGLRIHDNIDALSFGKDGGNVLYFSVCPNSKGQDGTDVYNQAVISPVGSVSFPTPTNTGGGDPGNEAAGDVFQTPVIKNQPVFGYYMTPGASPGGINLHQLYIDEMALGLQAPENDGSYIGPPEDDLNALEMSSISDRQWGVDIDGDGLPDRGRCVFFSVDRYSPQILAGRCSPADILVTRGPVRDYAIYANAHTMGLDADADDVDALVLSDVGKLGWLDPGRDEALFSLAPGSLSLSAIGASPADVFYTKFDGTFSIYATAGEIGLLEDDNINALDISHFHEEPEPTVEPFEPTLCFEEPTLCFAEPTQCYYEPTLCGDEPTLCYEEATLCYAEPTVCVEEPTQCYHEPTLCGDEPTICATQPTECPDQPTECMPETTICPRDPTLCYDEPTLCYEAPTQCFNEPTLCFAEPTQCYDEPTQCGEEATICYDEPTLCFYEPTQCSNEPTQCNPEPTLCYLEPTQCVDEATVCSDVQTVCPDGTGGTQTVCPDVITECPEQRTVCPVKPTVCLSSDVVTYCPDSNINTPTVCPQEPTRCPEIPTKCPQKPTFCSANQDAVVTICNNQTTICPVLDTFCPAIITECMFGANTVCADGTVTQCPDEPTTCSDPSQTTQCPDEPTLCAPELGVPTSCPVLETICPRIDTVCPANRPTICPFIDTQCVSDDTVTECPNPDIAPTVCPFEPTQCIVEPTQCPDQPTSCNTPGELTYCPGGPRTICPVIETECPREDITTCPKLPTECSLDSLLTVCADGTSTVTFCQNVTTVCPAIVTECGLSDQVTQCAAKRTAPSSLHSVRRSLHFAV